MASNIRPVARCGGTLRGYFLPTRFAGPTNVALALIDFADLGAYEAYRAKLAADAEHEATARVDPAIQRQIRNSGDVDANY